MSTGVRAIRVINVGDGGPLRHADQDRARTRDLVDECLRFLPRAMARRFGTRPAQLLGAVGTPALLAMPFGALTWWFSRTYGATDWIGIAYQMAAAAAVYLAFSWLLVFRRDERADLLSRFRMAVRAVAV